MGSQAFVDPATKSFTGLGGKIVINQPIKLGASSYRTEVAAMLKTNPDVIFTEALGSAGTYLKEVKTQNNGKMIAFIGSSATIDPTWFQQVRDAIGIDDLLKYYAGVDLGYTFSGPAYAEFLTNLNAAASTFADAPKYKQRGSTLHLYDGIIMTALAMVATNSADRTVYNPKIIDIAAVGFTMQFGITNMINLAYGEVMISSAYVAYYLNKAGISIWIGMVAGALFGAVFSFLLNRIVYAPFLRKGTSHIGMVIVSLPPSLLTPTPLLPTLGYSNLSYQATPG